MNVALFRTAGSLVAWAVLYLASGHLSLALDDPVSRVAFVWLPAGVAVAAFLLTERSRWLALLAALLIGRTVLDLYWGHDLATSLMLACISLGSDLACAWFVRRYTRRREALYTVLTLIGAAFLMSIPAAALGVGWLVLDKGVDFSKTVWIWWSANVTGILLGTSLLITWVAWPRRPTPRPEGRTLVFGWFAWLVLCIGALASFWMKAPSGMDPALRFAVACLPIALAVVLSLAWRNLGGPLALWTLTAIVLYGCANGRGPLAMSALGPGEGLLVAQCYLVGAALLLAFVRAMAIAQASGFGGAIAPVAVWAVRASDGGTLAGKPVPTGGRDG